MPISFSMIVLSSQMVVTVADGMPNFDIGRSCKLDVAATTGLSVDQSIKSCVNDEQRAGRPMVEIPRAKPGKLHLAREHRRHAELRQFADMPADGAVEPVNARCDFHQ
jgi:hypothetical protein